MEQVKTSDNWDSYSSYLNFVLGAIAALCSAKPLSTTEFISIVSFIKEWPSSAPVVGLLKHLFFINNQIYKNIIIIIIIFRRKRKRKQKIVSLFINC